MAENEQPEADHEEVRAIVERIQRAAAPNTTGEDSEDNLWGIAREMKRTQDALNDALDRLQGNHSERPTLTVAELQSRLLRAPPEALVVLHVGSERGYGAVEVFVDAKATPEVEGAFFAEPVAILSSSPPSHLGSGVFRLKRG